jgi:hypothetical protein
MKYTKKDREIADLLLELGDNKLENFYLKESGNGYLIGCKNKHEEGGWYLNLEEDEETHQAIVEFLIKIEAPIISRGSKLWLIL